MTAASGAILEPQHRKKVEVIRGLVQKKEFGFCEQCHGQRDEHAPSTRQGFGSLLEQVWSELQTCGRRIKRQQDST